MKAHKETIRKYYKYIDWEQPILTSNGVMGGNSFACSASTVYSSAYPYLAFDGDGSVDGWHSQQGVPQWISWYNPEKLSISSIAITNTRETGNPDTFKNYEVQVSDDNSTWRTIYSGTNTTGANQTWIIDLSNIENYSHYFRIYITSFNHRNYGRASLINITAKILSQGSESDYDFSEVVDVYRLPTKQVPIYEKYDYEYLNTLPTYANAAQGEAGINGISFTPADMYFCVAKSQNGTIKDYASYPVTWSFGDREFKMDSYSYTGWGANMSHHGAGLTSITASNDGINWETITLPDTQYRKYYRFNWYAPEAGRWGKMGMNYFNFYGTLRKKVVSTNGEPVEIVTHYQGILD